MKTVNALTIRNKFGSVLQELEEAKEPILITKGRKVRAVLITPGDFQVRFLDKQAEEEKERWMKKLAELRAPRLGSLSSLEALRDLRGYRF
jgi:PHD/YefM family antitoxin component YafN of YafNO toxin-antitoxin module